MVVLVINLSFDSKLFIKTQFNKTDDFPKFGNFQITQDHDHVIDDVY